MRWAVRGWAVPAAAAGLAACTSAPAPPPPSPGETCRAVSESLAAAVPPGESIAELQARGIRVRTPMRFPPGAAPRPAQASGAVVRLMIAPDGSVVPGSPQIAKSIGEAQVGAAMEAAALSMSFEVDPGANAGAPVAFSTLLAVCPRP